MNVVAQSITFWRSYENEISKDAHSSSKGFGIIVKVKFGIKRIPRVP